MSQKELALLCGVTEALISKIENDEYTPSVSVAFYFEFLFQKPLGDLFPAFVVQAKENLFTRMVNLTNSLEKDEERLQVCKALEDRASYLASVYEDE